MWQTLAPEIVFEILQFLPAPKLSLTKPHQFPWHLGHVCSMWRGVFLSYPQFWATFIVDITEAHQLNDLERALTILKTCLIDRGGDHPISFKFSLHPSYCPSISQTPEALCCGELLDTLLAHSARWRNAYFSLLVAELQTIYHVKGHTPILQSFQFTSANGWSEVVDVCGGFLADAPQLTRVYLEDSGTGWETCSWSSLTTVHFNNPILPVTLLSRLEHACRLEELVIRQDFSDEFSLDNTTPITLPFLKVLHVPSLDTLPLFKMPVLEELFMRNDLFKFDDSLMEVMNSSTFSSLTCLRKLSIVLGDEKDLMQLIPLMPPTVQELSVYSNSARVLETISDCSRARDLKMLTVATWHLTEGDKDELSRIITSWQVGKTGVSPFESLMQFSLVLPQVYRAHGGDSRARVAIPEEFINILSRHLEELGIHHSIQLENAVSADHLTYDIHPFHLL